MVRAGTRHTVQRGTDAFESIVHDLDTPTFVVTTAAGGEQAGCLVGFASQCSMEPARFAVWLSKANRTYRVAQRATTLVVHLLRAGDHDLAQHFGGETGDDVDKFTGTAWHAGPDGCPVLDRCDWFAGSILERVDTGDHVAFVLEPGSGEVTRRGSPPLGIKEIGDIEPGHEP